MDGWTKPKGGAQYSNVSQRTFREWLKDGLKHSKLPSGTILIQFSAIDEYLKKFEVTHDQVDEFVEEVMDEIRGDA